MIDFLSTMPYISLGFSVEMGFQEFERVFLQKQICSNSLLHFLRPLLFFFLIFALIHVVVELCELEYLTGDIFFFAEIDFGLSDFGLLGNAVEGKITKNIFVPPANGDGLFLFIVIDCFKFFMP